MSVVSARVYKEKIIVSADSIKVQGDSKNTSSDFSKLVRINDMIIGGSGYCQELSLMWHFARNHKPDGNDEKAVLEFFVEFARWKKELIGDSSVYNSYILVFADKCFRINDMFVYEVNEYCAIGAGRDFANAALYLGHTPREAVKVASELSCYCAEPILEEVYIK